MRKRIGFFITTFLLLGVIFFCFSTTAYSQSVERANRMQKERMDVAEREFLREIGSAMEEQGFAYSGVTMTKTYEEDGGLIYQVAINHRSLSYLSGAEIADLGTRLRERLMTLAEEESMGQAKFQIEFTCFS